MRRRDFITGIVGSAAAWPRAALAQQSEWMRRIGVLIALGENDPEGQIRIAAFRRGLQSLGWVEDRNVQIDYRLTGSHSERLPAAAAEIVGTRPDVIFAGNTTALGALQRATTSIPIVFAQVGDPVARGFVASLARPGGNITGFALHEIPIATKWVEIVKEIAPNVNRIGIIYDPANPASLGFLPVIEGAARTLGMRTYPSAVRDPAEIERAIELLGAEPNGALVALSGPITAVYRNLIIPMAVKHRLPLLHPYRYFTAAGGLTSYGPDVVDQYRLAASYVDRILKGEKPQNLPVQLPTKYSLTINLKTAKAIGLDVPAMILARADEVIE